MGALSTYTSLNSIYYVRVHSAKFRRIEPVIIITSHFSLMALEMLGVRCTVVE